MLFNSFGFLVFVACTFAIYYAPRATDFQIITLIAASLIFYGSYQPLLLPLLISCLSVNIITSYLILISHTRWRATYATLGVVFNVCTLIFFKYGPLIINTMPFTTGSLGAFIVALPLPLGISFFTFRGITLLVDTLKTNSTFVRSCRTRDDLIRHASKVSLYFLFFPQLVAGPITKSRNFLPQIAPKLFRDVEWEYAFRNVILGYFLKMVIADNLSQQTFWIA